MKIKEIKENNPQTCPMMNLSALNVGDNFNFR